MSLINDKTKKLNERKITKENTDTLKELTINHFFTYKKI